MMNYAGEMIVLQCNNRCLDAASRCAQRWLRNPDGIGDDKMGSSGWKVFYFKHMYVTFWFVNLPFV